MSDVKLQTQIVKPIVEKGVKQNGLSETVIVLPTKKNMEAYELYIEGHSTGKVSKILGITRQSAYQHISRVAKYYATEWRGIQLNRVRARANKVLDSFDVLVERNDSRTVNNYLDKNVYPNKQVIETRNLNANIDLTMGKEDSDSMYDTDVEVVDTDSQVVKPAETSKPDTPQGDDLQ